MTSGNEDRAPTRPGASDRRRDERVSIILKMLAQHREIKVRTLPDLLQVSGATVRRDLAAMETEGLVHRSYGKITAVRRGSELPISLRHSQNAEAKRRIGALTSSLIPGRPLTVALGGGSTVGCVARSLAGRSGLTVVTNALDTASSLITRQQVNVVVTGGTVRSLSNDLVGTTTEKALRGHRFDFAVVGVDGLSPDGGLTRHSAKGANVDRVMLEQADHRIVVADSSKMGRSYRAKIADLAAVHTVVTDSHANVGIVTLLRQLGIRTTLVLMPPRGSARPASRSPGTTTR
ncbi:DeoR/GlpR family DNA-binding transcription regulator [Streptomyces sp. ODS05-4]|uniref:DeoR/GlpR family DNA-binding transcription regulator n=1 Tax=Streptomyces sp. ODS05-4 TaxID=2944939 RepID=UPI00210CAB0B|nr:DeoR/GlpR family DNA-binding transcription regulator [Streptomyces sp. ODS05-4]